MLESYVAMIAAATSCAQLEVPACVEIHLRRPSPQMVVYVEGEKTHTFKVAAGKLSTPTPRGNFYVYEYTDQVHWPAGNGKSYGPNHPRNAMQGGYYAAFLNLNGLPVAFHSTNNPGSVGTYASGGCIRMYTADAKTVIDLTFKGMPVLVK